MITQLSQTLCLLGLARLSKQEWYIRLEITLVVELKNVVWEIDANLCQGRGFFLRYEPAAAVQHINNELAKNVAAGIDVGEIAVPIPNKKTSTFHILVKGVSTTFHDWAKAHLLELALELQEGSNKARTGSACFKFIDKSSGYEPYFLDIKAVNHDTNPYHSGPLGDMLMKAALDKVEGYSEKFLRLFKSEKSASASTTSPTAAATAKKSQAK